MAEHKEMSLFLRSGHVITVPVTEARISRSPLGGEFCGLEWTGVDDATALRLRQVRLDAIDAITFRDVPEPATS